MATDLSTFGAGTTSATLVRLSPGASAATRDELSVEVRDLLDDISEDRLVEMYDQVSQILATRFERLAESAAEELRLLDQLLAEMGVAPGHTTADEGQAVAGAKEIAELVALISWEPASRVCVRRIFDALPEVGGVAGLDELLERAVDAADAGQLSRLAGLSEPDLIDAMAITAEVVTDGTLLSDGLSLLYGDRLITVTGRCGKVEVDGAAVTIVSPRRPSKISAGDTTLDADADAPAMLISAPDTSFRLRWKTNRWLPLYRETCFRRSNGEVHTRGSGSEADISDFEPATAVESLAVLSVLMNAAGDDETIAVLVDGQEVLAE